MIEEAYLSNFYKAQNGERRVSIKNQIVNNSLPKLNFSSHESQVNQLNSKVYINHNTIQDNPSRVRHAYNTSRTTIAQQKFKQIQQILTRQNCNLRDHKDFLINEVRKCNQLLKKYKGQIKVYQRRIFQLEEENNIHKMQYEQIKQYVFQGIRRMETIVDERSFHSNFNQTLKQSGLLDLQSFMKFQENCNKQNPILQIKIQDIGLQSRNIQNDSTAEDLLEQLNQQFQTLMDDYRATYNHESRKKCIQLAKQIKSIKNSIEGSNKRIPLKKPPIYKDQLFKNFEREQTNTQKSNNSSFNINKSSSFSYKQDKKQSKNNSISHSNWKYTK